MATSARMTVEAKEIRGLWALKRSLEGHLNLGEGKKIEEEKNVREEYGGAEADIVAVREKHCV